MLIRIGHSPDPDDAFMFYALTAGKVKAEGIEVEHVLEDIESLNRRARTGELEVTAVSAATYVMVHEQYRMMDPGASMGKGYGPILVSKEPVARNDLETKVVAIPGSHTTAALLRRSLGEDVHRKLSQALRESIDYAYAHVDEAIDYAMRYGRGIDKETCKKFVLMYVNDYTKRLGPDGKAALERLYSLAHS